MPEIAQKKQRSPAGAIGAAFVAVTACAVGFWFAMSHKVSDPLARAASEYRANRWASAAELARQTLALRKGDLAALRIFARSSVRLGRDAPAMAIYQRRIDEKRLEAEDYLLLGIALQRQGRTDAAGEAWKKALEAGPVSPQLLDEVARFCVRGHHWEEAIEATERLSNQLGWRAHGTMMLATIRVELNNMPDAAVLFRSALDLDPTVVEKAHNQPALRKTIARTFLKMARPADAREVLQPIVDHGADTETAWLLSRVYLQEGDKTRALAALKQAGSYRAANPLEAEPGPYIGETRCEKCHATIFRKSLATRHTRTYYRGTQLDRVPLPNRPMPDPDDAEVTHTFQRRDGALHAETRVGSDAFDAVVEYAFGTDDRYLTMVSHDATGGYHICRLSYYDTPQGKGWDRSTLDKTHPTRAHPAEFQGESIGVRDGLAKCLYCHLTNPRTGHDSIGPETADRAIGCERCHGPGGNHVSALQIGFPDSAIINPAGASPAVVTSKQCNDCHILQKQFEEDPENPGWIRSQGIGWTRSRCNTESGGAFGCVTCHDPHQSASAVKTADYEVKCLTCHASTTSSADKKRSGSSAPAGAGTPARPCPVNAANGCVQCHMPRVRIDSLHMELTDHWIRVHDRSKVGHAPDK